MRMLIKQFKHHHNNPVIRFIPNSDDNADFLLSKSNAFEMIRDLKADDIMGFQMRVEKLAEMDSNSALGGNTDGDALGAESIVKNARTSIREAQQQLENTMKLIACICVVNRRTTFTFQEDLGLNLHPKATPKFCLECINDWIGFLNRLTALMEPDGGFERDLGEVETQHLKPNQLSDDQLTIIRNLCDANTEGGRNFSPFNIACGAARRSTVYGITSDGTSAVAALCHYFRVLVHFYRNRKVVYVR